MHSNTSIRALIIELSTPFTYFYSSSFNADSLPEAPTGVVQPGRAVAAGASSAALLGGGGGNTTRFVASTSSSAT